ncbi:MAG: helix-turn-helix transcriptional regulator [Opitutales bacterium]
MKAIPTEPADHCGRCAATGTPAEDAAGTPEIAGLRPRASRRLLTGIRCGSYRFENANPRSRWQRLSPDHCHIGLIHSGRCGLALPDLGARDYSPGSWFLLRGDLARFLPHEATELSWIALPRSLLARIRDERPRPAASPALECLLCPKLEEPAILEGRADAGLRNLGEALRDALGDGDPLDFEIRALQWLRALLAQPQFGRGALCREGARDCRQADEERLRAVAHYLEAHPGADHSLADLSRRFHLNEFKLKGGFKALHGTTVFGYLRERRLEAAARRLRDPRAGVLETALAVGYSNPSHFARNFKARFGLLPKAYQCVHAAPSVRDAPPRGRTGSCILKGESNR